jgi:hypothetical protein
MKNLTEQQAAMRERWQRLKLSGSQSKNELTGLIAARARWAHPRLSKQARLERMQKAMRERQRPSPVINV